VSLSDVFFQALNVPKLIFSRSFVLVATRGAYDAPPDSLVGAGEGDTPSPYNRHLQTKFLAMPMPADIIISHQQQQQQHTVIQ